MKQKLILGGPGCGKTTHLLSILEEELASGIKPHQIAFVAFTRKAAHEAIERAKEKFGLHEDDLPYFRTLHSLAFKQLGLTAKEVMGTADYREIGHALGLTFGARDDENGLPMSRDNKGDQLLYTDQIARLTLSPLEAVAGKLALQPYFECRLFRDTLNEFKAARKAMDFSDMIEKFVDGECEVPKFKVVFVDEGQDLSPLQWKMVQQIVYPHAERVYIAGDDDQAIYEWAGADVQHFLHLEGDQHVLPVSHRLPSNVFTKANGILSRIKNRYAKNWSPAYDGGEVKHYAEPEYIDFSKETWLLLARNRYMLPHYVEIMRERGYPYMMDGKSSVENDTVKAIMLWEKLRKHEALDLPSCRLVMAKLLANKTDKAKRAMNGADPEKMYKIEDLQRDHGLLTTEDWMLAIRMTQSEREYYRAVRRAGESFIARPRMTISTIHQVKGGEADHVVLKPDLAWSCYEEMVRNFDSEARVFYVGATRAKKGLHVIYPRTNKFFDV